MSGAATDHYKVWIDDWQAKLEGDVHHLTAAAGEMALDLKLTPEKPPVIHGENGVSQKAAGEGVCQPLLLSHQACHRRAADLSGPNLLRAGSELDGP